MSKNPKILIIGAGFGGIQLVKKRYEKPKKYNIKARVINDEDAAQIKSFRIFFLGSRLRDVLFNRSFDRSRSGGFQKMYSI